MTEISYDEEPAVVVIKMNAALKVLGKCYWGRWNWNTNRTT